MGWKTGRFFVLAMCLLWWAVPSEARCNYMQLNAEQMAGLFAQAYKDRAANDTLRVHTNARTDGDLCLFLFLKTYGTGVIVTKLKVTSPPTVGKMFQSAPLRYQYQPAADFKGIDRLTLELCGKQANQSEVCFSIHYGVEVRCQGEVECGGDSLAKEAQ